MYLQLSSQILSSAVVSRKQPELIGGCVQIKKVHLVKAMVFPVVMYACESWTIKKTDNKELMLLNHGVGEDS